MGPFDEAAYTEIVLERLRLAKLEYLDDLPGVTLRADVRLDIPVNRAVLDVRAYVLAGVKREEPVTISDTVWASTLVPERPVRDGALIWLSDHAPGPVARLLRRHVRYREIETYRRVQMQQISYYGCPHLAIRSERDNVHIKWMAEKSGQI